MQGITRLPLFLLSIWFCLSVATGVSGRFESASPLVVAVTVWTLAGLLLSIFWKIAALNQSAKGIKLEWLIALHLTRLVGIYFLALCESGELSCAFAVPAAAGDITVALGVAVILFAGAVDGGWRKLILTWNILGLLDILLVVFRAYRVGLTDWAGMAPLRALPLMLLPTFLVPLIIASHVVIFARLMTRRNELVSSH
jgi:hypothetical protein